MPSATSKTFYVITRSDGSQLLLRAHDTPSADRLNTALIELAERDLLRDYEQLTFAQEGDFAGLGNKSHALLAAEFGKMLALGSGDVAALRKALDEAF